MKCYTLPGISFIEYIPIDKINILPDKYYTPGDEVTAEGEFEDLPIVDIASCSVSSQRTENGLIYTTTIQARTIQEENSFLEDELQNLYHIYRITDVRGNKYLVGVNYAPFPEINFEPQNDNTPAGQRVTNVEITFVSTIPPLKITVL